MTLRIKDSEMISLITGLTINKELIETNKIIKKVDRNRMLRMMVVIIL